MDKAKGKMKKIIHILVIPQMTGCQQITYDILTSLPSDSYDKYVMCSGPIPQNFRDIFEKNNITLIESKNLTREISLKDIYAFFELYFFFKKNKFDIVHTNSTKPGIIARVAAKLAGHKYVIHTVHGIAFHSFISMPKRVTFYFLELFSCLFGSLNITVNKYYLKYYPKWLIKSKCIYNGVNFDKLEVKPNKKSEPCVAFFARLDEQKAPLIYIEIINKLINDYNLKNVRYILAGTGELMPQCHQLIKEYSLSDYIEVSGWISNKSEFLNQIDLLIQPSRWEAFGLNIVEAAYFSIPTIASKVEGLPEVVIDGKTGFTCDVNNIEEFSKRAAYLLENPEILSTMGNNAKEYVNSNFGIQLMTQNYIDLYNNINKIHPL